MRHIALITAMLASVLCAEEPAILFTATEPYIVNAGEPVAALAEHFHKAPYEAGDRVEWVWSSNPNLTAGTIIGYVGNGEYLMLTSLGITYVTPTDGLLQWLDGQNDGTNTLYDKSGNSYDVEMVQSGALTLNGTDEYINCGETCDLLATGDDWTIEFRANLDDLTSSDNVFSRVGDLFYGYRLEDINAATAGFFYRNVSNTTALAQFNKASGWATYRIEKESDTLSLYINDSPTAWVLDTVSGNNITGGVSNLGNLQIAARVTSLRANMDMSYFRITSVSDEVIYTFSETAGSIVYDTSGNGNHGAITTLDLATMREARQDDYHANMVNGFAAYTNGVDTVRVPALADGSGYATNAVSGYALEGEYPPIGEGVMHNNAETLLINTNDALLAHSGLWFTSSVPVNVSFDDAKAWTSGTDNTWVDFAGDPCVWTAGLIYTNGHGYTAAEYTAISNLYPNACGDGGILEPLYDVGGELILDVDGELILVQP